MLQATKWLKRKAFALHPLETSVAFEREHMAGLLSANRESELLELRSPHASPACSSWFERHLSWVEHDLQNPLARPRQLPFPLRSWFIHQHPRSQGHNLSWEWVASLWVEVCLQLRGGQPPSNFPEGLLCNPFPQLASSSLPGPALGALEEQRRLLTSGTEGPSSLCSLGWLPGGFLCFQQPRWNLNGN